jgi:hypothetical protein
MWIVDFGMRNLKKIPNNKHQMTNKFQAPNLPANRHGIGILILDVIQDL